MDTKKKRKKLLIISSIVGVIVVCIALGIGYFLQKMNKIKTTQLAPEEIQVNDIEAKEEEVMATYTNIALFGVDNRTNGTYTSGNSDTIMIASINNKTKEVKLVSVYRDTYLRLKNDNYFGKANAAFNQGGAAQGLSVLNTNLDLTIQKYIAVDWYALVHAVDALGGISMEVTQEEMENINLYAEEVSRITGVANQPLTEYGQVTLNGVQATAFARIRKLAGNDYKRTMRQRMVIEAMFNKVKSANLMTINKLMDEILPEVETNLQTTEILGLAANLTQYKFAGTTGFPFEKTTMMMPTFGDCVIPVALDNNVAELHEYLFAGEVYSVSAAVQAISDQLTTLTGVNSENTEIDRSNYETE